MVTVTLAETAVTVLVHVHEDAVGDEVRHLHVGLAEAAHQSLRLREYHRLGPEDDPEVRQLGVTEHLGHALHSLL